MKYSSILKDRVTGTLAIVLGLAIAAGLIGYYALRAEAAKVTPGAPIGFTFEIDRNIKPSEIALPGLSSGPLRPVGVVIDPDGGRDEFVVNEVEFRPASVDDLYAFLRKYGGVVLRDSRAMIITEEGASLGPPAPFDNTHLIQVDLARSPLDDLARNMAATGVRPRQEINAQFGG
jgi:hypothetical protein